jgi:hypothetical protein
MNINLRTTLLSSAVVLALTAAATAKSSYQQEQMRASYSAAAPSLQFGDRAAPGFARAQWSSAFPNETDESGYRQGSENPQTN